MKRYVINEMIWPEVAAELENFKVAVVAVGSVEQHGPNTTFETDTARAYEFAKLLGERMGNKLLIFPPITYGISPHHMDFPGSATLRVETMINVITDVAVSIHKHGIKKILFINGHGGNKSCLDASVVKLKYEHNIDAYWSMMGTSLVSKAIKEKYNIPDKNVGHACQVETSGSMYLCPWIVRDDRVKGEVHFDGPNYKKLFKDGGMAMNWKNHASANGALGDATLSSYEMGKDMTEEILDYFVELVEEIIKL